LLWLAGAKGNSPGVAPGTITVPGGYTTRAAQTSSSAASVITNCTVIAADIPQGVQGATGTVAGTEGTSTDHCCALLVAMAPAPMPAMLDVNQAVRRASFY
jgi:hypothetical protein